MWDNHRLLNRIASLLYAAAGLVVLGAVITLVIRLPVFAVRAIKVSGEIGHTTRDQVSALARSELRGTFFTLDLEAARAAFEKLPWVRRASVRREWPDRLEVGLEEHVAQARWHDFGLVNTHGEVFEAASEARLPVFFGPDGSAREISVHYEAFRDALRAIGRVPVEVRLSRRGAWEVRLDDGRVLELGRQDVVGRLARFVAAYPQVAQQIPAEARRVDLRYPNGFAVRMPPARGRAPAA